MELHIEVDESEGGAAGEADATSRSHQNRVGQREEDDPALGGSSATGRRPESSAPAGRRGQSSDAHQPVAQRHDGRLERVQAVDVVGAEGRGPEQGAPPAAPEHPSAAAAAAATGPAADAVALPAAATVKDEPPPAAHSAEAEHANPAGRADLESARPPVEPPPRQSRRLGTRPAGGREEQARDDQRAISDRRLPGQAPGRDPDEGPKSPPAVKDMQRPEFVQQSTARRPSAIADRRSSFQHELQG